SRTRRNHRRTALLSGGKSRRGAERHPSWLQSDRAGGRGHAEGAGLSQDQRGRAGVGADRARDLCPRRNRRPERLSHRIAAVVVNGGVLIVAGGLIVTFWDGTR